MLQDLQRDGLPPGQGLGGYTQNAGARHTHQGKNHTLQCDSSLVALTKTVNLNPHAVVRDGIQVLKLHVSFEENVNKNCPFYLFIFFVVKKALSTSKNGPKLHSIKLRLIYFVDCDTLSLGIRSGCSIFPAPHKVTVDLLLQLQLIILILLGYLYFLRLKRSCKHRVL